MPDLSTRDALLNALKPEPQPVEVEGLGTVFLCPISTADRIEFLNEGRALAESDGIAGQANLTLKLLPKVLVDEDGNKLLTADDIEILQQSDARLVQALLEKAMDINGMTAKAVEEIKGN